jgi:hypothetical protein
VISTKKAASPPVASVPVDDEEPALDDVLGNNNNDDYGEERVVVPPINNGSDVDTDDQNVHEPEATVLIRNLDKAVTARDLLLVDNIHLFQINNCYS